jgi:DNA repair exonuclease SbcCD ATPase subunit
MRDKTFDEVLNNVFNELVLLEKELINYKEQIEKLKKQKEIMREGLEFYGNLNTYYINGRTDMRNHIQDGDLEHVLYHYMNYENLEWIGGKKAREALKKVEVME